MEDFRAEIQKRDQDIMAMTAKIRTLEEQHADYQRHIAVLKEAICAKEEHCNLLQADVSTANFYFRHTHIARDVNFERQIIILGKIND